MANDELLTEFKKNNKYTYIYKLSEQQIFSQLVNLEQLTFELTDACNLKCKYCGYGSLYNTYEKRENKYMDFEMAKQTIDYLYKIWSNNPGKSSPRKIVFGFYGGEPLLNMGLIKQIVNYLESLNPIPNTIYGYNMTSNAVLLDKYQDFFAEKEFDILISLDGDEWGDSYRTDFAGTPSFNRVFQNIQSLKNSYPEYFENHINFNSVLHDRNDTKGIKQFIFENFGKKPSVAELNNFGIVESQKEVFEQMYHKIPVDISGSDEDFFNSSPEIMELYRLVKFLSGNYFYSHNYLLKKTPSIMFPTGTCLPFEKKLFVTVRGNILACERIDQKYVLGHVTPNGVDLDLKKIAKNYSSYYQSLEHLCNSCYRKPVCFQCMFYIPNLGSEHPQCPGFMDKEAMQLYINNLLSILQKQPELYEKLSKEILLQS